MFSRRDVLATAAAGAAMSTTAAAAASFGNPDEPPQGSINAKNPASATDPGPQNPAIRDQFPSAFSPPATDVGSMPQIWASFNNAPRRIQDGGWAREVTQADFAISKDDLRRQYATDGRWHPRVALASGGRVGVHDLRSLPEYRDRSDRPPLCCGRQGGRYLVFSSRVSAFPAGPCARWLRIRHLLRQWRAERVQHPLGDRLVRPHASFRPCRKFRCAGRDVRQNPTARSLDLSGQSAGRSALLFGKQ